MKTLLKIAGTIAILFVVFFILHIVTERNSSDKYTPSNTAPYQSDIQSVKGVAIVKKLGEVSVYTKNILDVDKNKNKLIKQLKRKADRQYPDNNGIENIRYEGDYAIADVIRND